MMFPQKTGISLQRAFLLCSSWDAARPLCKAAEYMKTRCELVLGTEPWFWPIWPWDGPPLLFCRSWPVGTKVLLLKTLCRPFSLHFTQEHTHWMGTSGLAKGSWPCHGKLESYSDVSRPSAGGGEHRTGLVQQKLTSPSPKGALASSCHCWWWAHAGYQPGSSEDCVEPIKALMKCGCLVAGGSGELGLWRPGTLISNSTKAATPLCPQIWDTETPFPRDSSSFCTAQAKGRGQALGSLRTLFSPHLLCELQWHHYRIPPFPTVPDWMAVSLWMTNGCRSPQA